MKNLTIKTLATLTAVSMLASCGVSGSEGAIATTTAESTTTTISAAEPTTTSLVASDINLEPHDTTSSFVIDESNTVEIMLGSTITASSDVVSIEGTTATITSAGAYEVQGTLSDGAIIVDTEDDGVVQIILNDADITNTSGSALAIMNADAAVVILADGSSNILSDGAQYVFAEDQDEPNAALFSTADLTLGGNGALAVVGNYNDGISSKDGLVIVGGSLTVDAVDDGIRGKDYVVVEGGAIEIAAGGDGIKSDEDEDPERGYVSIAEGTIAIASSDDGIQASTDVLISGGTIDITAAGTGVDESSRGIQGYVSVWISGGSLTAEASDDAIHSNSTVTIDGGELMLAAGDDGVHGDLFVNVNGGTTLITESFEGIEAEVVTINDGLINITSSDDGINVASAETSTTTDVAVQPEPAADATGRPARGQGGGQGGGPGGGPGGDAGIGDFYVYINGGTIAITITGDLAEQGDGIDANGHVVMTGGVVAVNGPTDTRNSAIDYSGGSFEMSGGLFIGTNVNGRNSEGIGAGSSQTSLYITLGSIAEPGTFVHIQSTDGDPLATFEATNQFDVIVFSSPELAPGAEYEIYLGGSGSGESSAGLYDAYIPGTLAGTSTAG